MRQSSTIPRRQVRIALRLLVLFVLVAAVFNVPWALTFMRSRTTIGKIPTIAAEPDHIPRRWPSSTPHEVAWPPPDDWEEGSRFGCRSFRASYKPGNENGSFAMEVQQMGWPFPVIEQKRMWWDWNDPTLNGPEPDPALGLMMAGLLVNPLLLGIGAWALLVFPWIAAIVVKRRSRRRELCCMACGYPVGVSPICTECGGALS